MNKISRRTVLGSLTASGIALGFARTTYAAESKVENEPALKYQHVDVFTKKPLSGNGLNVFINDHILSHDQMLRITQELKQFEAIFLNPTSDPYKFKTSVFTTVEQLAFAGHPLLGAAAVLHNNLENVRTEENFQLELSEKTVSVKSVITAPGSYQVTMDQGVPEFGEILNKAQCIEMLEVLNLEEKDWQDELPIQMVSTGLPHLIVPIKSGIEKSKITRPDFEQLLLSYGAKFVYVFDVERQEGRTWENSGTPEDVATASASGPTAAYMVKYDLAKANEEIVIRQGRFVNRPSEMRIIVENDGKTDDLVKVSADVCLIARGIFENYS